MELVDRMRAEQIARAGAAKLTAQVPLGDAQAGRSIRNS
jgi:hypothetical protein